MSIRQWFRDAVTKGRYLYLATDESARQFHCRGRVLDTAEGFRRQMQRRGLATRLYRFHRGLTTKGV